MVIVNTKREITFFKNKNIKQVCIGGRDGKYRFYLFLEYNGIIWSCGANEYSQCGYTTMKEKIYKPNKIHYFIENNIKINYICCGLGHCLALDINNNVYSWRHNLFGQCDISSNKEICSPS